MRGGQFGIDRQREHFARGPLRLRARAGLIPEVREAGLEMQRQRVVHRRADAARLEVRLQLVAPLAAQRVLVEDRLVGRVDRRRPHLRHAGQRLGVIGRVRAPPGAPRRRGAAAWPTARPPATRRGGCCTPLRRGSTAATPPCMRSRLSRWASAWSRVTIIPPSPYPPRFLDGKKLNVPIVATSPAMRHSPSIMRRAPMDCAASSITGIALRHPQDLLDRGHLAEQVHRNDGLGLGRDRAWRSRPRKC